jgi:hypothetical protein
LTKAALFNPDNNFLVVDVFKPWQPDTAYDKLPQIKTKEEDFGKIFKDITWSTAN